MTLEILPDSVYASLFKCWNRRIIVGKTVVALPAVSHFASYLAFLVRYPLWIWLWTTGSRIWHLRIVRLKKTGPRETTSHDRRVLSGSANVLWFERWLSPFVFQPLIGEQTLFSRPVECRFFCNDSFIQDVRLTRGCLKSLNTSFFAFFFLFSGPERDAACCLHSSD